MELLLDKLETSFLMNLMMKSKKDNQLLNLPQKLKIKLEMFLPL